MYPGIKHLHSYTAYLTLAFLVIAVTYSLLQWLGNKPFTKQSKLIFLLALVSTHIQFVAGIILYFVSPLGMSNFSGEAMKNAITRLYIVEHPLTMIIAIVLITIGYSKAKRVSSDKSKFKFIWLFMGLGLILVLTRIPWQAWL